MNDIKGDVSPKFFEKMSNAKRILDSVYLRWTLMRSSGECLHDNETYVRMQWITEANIGRRNVNLMTAARQTIYELEGEKPVAMGFAVGYVW